MSHLYKGSCLCGLVTYELSGEFQSFFLCHCSRCQKDTGSLHAANLFAKSSTLTWTRGQTRVQTYQHPGTQHTKSFCQHCGSALPYFLENINCVVVPAGSLDGPVPIVPTAKLFVGERAAWSNDLQAVPCYETLPTPSNR